EVRAEDGKERGVLRDRQELTLAEKVAAGGEVAAEHEYAAEKRFCRHRVHSFRLRVTASAPGEGRRSDRSDRASCYPWDLQTRPSEGGDLAPGRRLRAAPVSMPTDSACRRRRG